MDLERVAAVIRPRSPWEAIDLGFGMVRAWWRPIAAAWLAAVAPVWCLLFLLLSGKPGWALFLLWWLRPLFDRVPLFVVSRRLFGEPTPAGAVVAELPRLWGHDLWAGLTAQRLDPARSFHLPIGQLEGLTGGQRKRRGELLGRGGRSAAVWLTAGCSLLELAVAFGLLEVLGLMAPQPESGVAAALRAAAEGDAPYWLHLVAGGIAFLAFTLLEPFYVAAGFSLYLSRRTRLEGWDVEIAFRRLASRLTGAARRGRAVAGLLLVALTPLAPLSRHPTPLPGRGGNAVEAASQEVAWGRPSPGEGERGGGRGVGGEGQDPEEVIHRILAHPDFRTTETITTLHRKGAPRRAVPERPDDGPIDRAAPQMVPAMAGVIGLFVAAVLVVVLAALSLAVWRDWRRNPRSAKTEDGKPPLPDAVFGLDIRPESLPDDVPAAAWAAWERGDPTAALALLYRGALACLVHRDGLEIAPSWTEGDCLAVVRRRGPHPRPSPSSPHTPAGRGETRSQAEEGDEAVFAFPPSPGDRAGGAGRGAGGEGLSGDWASSLPATFAQLTQAWQSTAYAHRPPDRAAAQALCAAWSRIFRTREAA